MGWMPNGSNSTAKLPQKLWHLLVEKWLHQVIWVWDYSIRLICVWVYISFYCVPGFCNIITCNTGWGGCILKDCSLWRPRVGADCPCWGTAAHGWDPHLSREESVKRKDWKRQLLWTDLNPHSPLPRSTEAEEVEKQGMKEGILTCEDEEVKSKGCNFVFVPHYSSPLSIANKLNSFFSTQVCFLHAVTASLPPRPIV